MAPINLPDGSQVSEIVLPDGSTASEVLAPDGSSVFRGIPDSGVARWTFDDADTSGSTAVNVWGRDDSSITQTDGTINGAVTGQSGANQTYSTGESYQFNGNDNVDISSVSGDIEAPLSFAVWVYKDNTTDTQTVFQYQSHRFSIMYNLSSSSAGYQFRGFDGTNVKTVNSGITQAQQFYHLAVTYDGSTVEFYVDGSSEGTVSMSQIDAGGDSNNNASIGERIPFNDRGWEGRIDDPRLYSRALTTTEVSDLYSTGSIQ